MNFLKKASLIVIGFVFFDSSWSMQSRRNKLDVLAELRRYSDIVNENRATLMLDSEDYRRKYESSSKCRQLFCKKFQDELKDKYAISEELVLTVRELHIYSDSFHKLAQKTQEQETKLYKMLRCALYFRITEGYEGSLIERKFSERILELLIPELREFSEKYITKPEYELGMFLTIEEIKTFIKDKINIYPEKWNEETDKEELRERLLKLEKSQFKDVVISDIDTENQIIYFDSEIILIDKEILDDSLLSKLKISFLDICFCEAQEKNNYVPFILSFRLFDFPKKIYSTDCFGSEMFSGNCIDLDLKYIQINGKNQNKITLINATIPGRIENDWREKAARIKENLKKQNEAMKQQIAEEKALQLAARKKAMAELLEISDEQEKAEREKREQFKRAKKERKILIAEERAKEEKEKNLEKQLKAEKKQTTMSAAPAAPIRKNEVVKEIEKWHDPQRLPSILRNPIPVRGFENRTIKFVFDFLNIADHVKNAHFRGFWNSDTERSARGTLINRERDIASAFFVPNYTYLPIESAKIINRISSETEESASIKFDIIEIQLNFSELVPALYCYDADVREPDQETFEGWKVKGCLLVAKVRQNQDLARKGTMNLEAIITIYPRETDKVERFILNIEDKDWKD